MTSSFDVIVVGLGGMGSATAYQLARRGQRVLGLEMFQPGHAFGSSHGEHRIIRSAYFEAPDYVPLIERAYTLWRELESESGDHDLLDMTGGLMLGRPDTDVVSGSLASARAFNLPHELLDAEQTAQRFPGFRPAGDMLAVFEENAGYLRPERCTAAHLALAARHGAELRFGEEVVGWKADGSGVKVTTSAGEYVAARVVITTGPWAAELLAGLGLPLEVERIVNVHFQPTRPELFTQDRCPIYIWQVPEGWYYGFPHIPGSGLKLGRHEIGEATTARTIRRSIDEAEIEQLRAMLDRYMPGASGAVVKTLTCMYTNTPDEHFILDMHPAHPQVVFGCGFSGHGFKFASVIGEILADLAVDGATGQDIRFLAQARFAGVA